MENNHLKTFCFLFKCTLFLQLTYSINHQIEATASPPEVSDRLSKLEAQNCQQEKDISLLKAEKFEDRLEIHKLRERVALLEHSVFRNSEAGSNILERSKRPARLLPVQVLYGTKKPGAEKEKKIFYGPPTNCSDLQKLGYTLNGYYLIKGKDESSNSSRIQITYCRFRQPPGGNKQMLEILIGNVEVKTRSVFFYVYRKSKFDGISLKFEGEDLNLGSGMNVTSGKFTAPVDGIYHFEFNCLKHNNDTNEKSVYLKKDDLEAGTSSFIAATHMAGVSNQLAGSLIALVALKSGDTAYLVSRGTGQLYDNSFSRYTQFVGWLVEEDLSLA